ncbi:lipocalin family protein [uncultured Pontibacter sp.]|uniref:lipocalin family protein n=1 Tax=uncultured Pontibacter sp. TaxID=453356 RepID=UPI00262797DB|nr:lipocalin family protein [uncultured Pontibacter sp.]
MKKKISFRSTLLFKLLPLFLFASALNILLVFLKTSIRPVATFTSCPPAHGCFAGATVELWGNKSFKYHYADCLTNRSFEGKWRAEADTLILNDAPGFGNTKYVISKDSTLKPLHFKRPTYYLAKPLASAKNE